MKQPRVEPLLPFTTLGEAAMSVVEKTAAAAQKPPLRVIRLVAENFKKLTAIEIRPTGEIVEISGPNGAGKSSVLDAIYAALAGKHAIQSRPIREGCERAFIKLDLGEIIVTRSFRRRQDASPPYTTELKVESADGGKFSGPQAILDAVVGTLGFDPMAFVRSDKKTQYEELRALVPGVDFDAVKRLNEADFAKRAEINARAKQLRAQAGPVTAYEGAPAERIDESGLVDLFQGSVEHNAAIEREKAQREVLSNQARDLTRTCAACEAEIDRLIALVAEQGQRRDVALAALNRITVEIASFPPLPEPVDATDIRSKLEDARAKNALVDARARANDLTADAEIAEAEAADLTAAMKKRTEDMQRAIAAAKIPVDGVSFGDGEILLHGVPIDQASTAQQIRASVQLAAAKTPRLHVVFVRDGSLLDKHSMKLLAEIADEFGMQCWIERVESGGASGFVIEDGHVREPSAVAAE